MKGMRPKGSAAELEVRRRLAIRMLQEGHSQADTARCTGASNSSVHRRRRIYKQKGEGGLSAKPHPGTSPKLTQAQKGKLVELLLKGPKADGFSTDLWTCPRIAQVIKKQFRVKYHQDHIGRLMRSLEWTPRKPQKRDYKRDEKAISRWLKKDWPRIKRKVHRRKAHLAFIDSSGFMLLPLIRRSWSPCGQTPIFYHAGSQHKKVSSISAITVSPKRKHIGLYYRFYSNRNVRWPQVVALLRGLLRHLRGYVVVVWDRGNPHRAKGVKQFLKRFRNRICVEWFPSYVPDLNPNERVWSNLKYHRIANHGFVNTKILHRRLLYHARRIRKRQNLLWSFIEASGLPFRRP
jgi:transposase